MGSFEVVLTQLSKARTRTGAVHATECGAVARKRNRAETERREPQRV